MRVRVREEGVGGRRKRGGMRGEGMGERGVGWGGGGGGVRGVGDKRQRWRGKKRGKGWGVEGGME